MGMEERKEKIGAAWLIAWLIGLSVVLAGTAAPAAPAAAPAETGRYAVVSGHDDKAYLVDTTTGAVWVLTYRTMATGREPIAIPYKFILRTPKNQGEFLAESTGIDVPMGPSSGVDRGAESPR
jgi:hypothetical protein